jgi:pimeloyl-ACP methyl ester carboxylesterase
MKNVHIKEEAVLFGERKSLVGVVSTRARTTASDEKSAVILLNAGIVHRVGPGRIYVKIARALAAMGPVVLRFDFSGIGDSLVRHDNLRFFKSAVRETQEAMDLLKATRGIEQFVLLGGCSGALVSLETACCDLRVLGAILINYPPTEDEDEQADADLKARRAAHYYRNFALFNLKSWGRLLRGKANYRQLLDVFRLQAKRQFRTTSSQPRRQPPFEANLRRLAQRDLRLSFLCSQGDPLLDELRDAGGNELQHLCSLGKATLDVIPRSDHTFSSLDDHGRLIAVITQRASAMTRECKSAVHVSEAAPSMDACTANDAVIRP